MDRQTYGSISSAVGLILILTGIYSLVYFEARTAATNILSVVLFFIGIVMLYAGLHIELKEEKKNDNRKEKFLERMGKSK